jgi:hypothetical protein
MGPSTSLPRPLVKVSDGTARPQLAADAVLFTVNGALFSMSALGQKRTFAVQNSMSALPPCVDGSELARTFLNVCSIGRCSHVFGLLARHIGPLAIMPCADQVPINSPHSRMRGGKWVVLIARSTGSALRAVRPFQPSHHAGWPTRSRLRRKRDGLFVAFALGHHGPGHPRDLVGKRDGGDLRGPPRQ